MNVGYVVTDLGFGGTQGFVQLAATELVRRGHLVTVVAERAPHDRAAALTSVGVRVHAFHTPPPVAGVAAALRADGVELIHLNVWEHLRSLLTLRRRVGVPLALSYHHVPRVSIRAWAVRVAKPWASADFLTRSAQVLRYVDAHVGCCDSSARGVRRELWPFARRNVFSLPNGVPLPAAPTPPEIIGGPAHFLQVGSLNPRKNPFATLRAFAEVRRRVPSARLTFVGDGPLRADLQRFAREHDVADVRFAGETPDAAAAYRACNVAVLPSLREGLPYTLIEAAGHGLPLVASAVDGNPEIAAEGVNALLVPPRDDAALAAAMMRLAESPELRGRLGSAGRQRVAERFEIGQHVERLIAIYRTVLDAVRAPAALMISQPSADARGEAHVC